MEDIKQFKSLDDLQQIIAHLDKFAARPVIIRWIADRMTVIRNAEKAL